MTQNNYKVLVIEDNSELMEQYRLKLSHEGFNPLVAIDGEQGLLLAADERPDVILLDILMPNMDGFEVLRAIKNNTSLNSIIIIISNLAGPEQVERAKALGADNYFVKSEVTPSVVVNKVKSLLNIPEEKAS